MSLLLCAEDDSEETEDEADQQPHIYIQEDDREEDHQPHGLQQTQSVLFLIRCNK